MNQPWTPKPGDRVARHPRQRQIDPVHFTIPSRRHQSSILASPLFLVYGFAVLISLGTALLLLPIAHEGSGVTPFVDALLTATSAATVTGLVTQDTASYWSGFGKATILALMFIGGAGFMAVATFLLTLIGQRAPAAERLLTRETLQLDHARDLARIATRVVLVAAGVQLVGLAVLAVRFSLTFSPAEAVWQAAFQAVSSFNSAGLVIFPNSSNLSTFRSDPVVLGITAALIVAGAVGYAVLVDVVRSRRFSLLNLNTKLVVVATLVLIATGAVVFLASEQDNPKTLGGLSLVDQIAISLFESVSGRTAGFSSVGFGNAEQQTTFLFTALMFIGGASASVAGGIKVNTAAVVVATVAATVRGRGRTSAFGREIPRAEVQRAFSVTTVALGAAFLVVLALLLSERDFPFTHLLFESVSALFTVGQSIGLTPELSDWGHIILIASMLMGRIGPIALGLVMATRGGGDVYRRPLERITIG